MVWYLIVSILDLFVFLTFIPVTYIWVTGNSIFQLDRYFGACVTGLTPSAPFITYTKWRRSLEKSLHI